VLGLFFSYIDIKANSIIPSIILHIFNNLINALLGLMTVGASQETMSSATTVYIIILLLLGLIGLVLFGKTLRGNKEDREEDSAPKHEVYEEFLAEETQGMDGLTWKTAAKSPCLWIFAVIYILIIISPIILSALIAKYPAFFG
ncbi:MAG: hypothetical protein PUK49_00345, partial [Oscillospiraceae bacterium]|nr:hypothetical protein [Oscillospiraceae bacterium]